MIFFTRKTSFFTKDQLTGDQFAIGDGAVTGAEALVKHDVEPYAIAAGTTADDS
jgi:serine acetyltransferase